MPITPTDPFHWRHYEGEVILCCVRWYLDLPLSYRQVAKLIRERGLGRCHIAVRKQVHIKQDQLIASSDEQSMLMIFSFRRIEPRQ